MAFRFSRAALTRNVVMLGLVSLLADVASDMVVPLLPIFLMQIGSGAAALGFIEGAGQAIAGLFKFISGHWADRARKLLPLAAAGYLLAGAVRPLLALATSAWHVFAVRGLDRVGKGLRTSPRDKLLAASAPRENLAEAFSFHRGMDHLGAALGPLLASGILLLWPGRLRLVFALAAIPGALAVFALLLVREGPTVPPPTEAEARGLKPEAPSRVSPLLLLSIALFTLGNSTDALLLLRARSAGVPLPQLPLLWMLLHLVRAGLSWPLGRLADRVGKRLSLALGWCWYSVCYLGFAVLGSPSHAWALFAAYGLVAGLTEGSERALVAESVEPARRGRALGLYNLVSGAGLLLASVLAGELWDRVSPAVALGAGASLAGMAAIALLLSTLLRK